MTVSYTIDDSVAIITIERPERRNAVDKATADALLAAFERFDADSDASVAILQGKGGYFCAGADLKAVAVEDGNRVAEEGDGPMGPTRMQLSKPVIAAIEGHAVAGGMELALWCDLRVVAEDAVFGIFCRRFGVPLVDLGTVRLPRLIGQSRAMDLILTGRPVEAEEALQIGLANRVVPPGQALEGAKTLARQIAGFPQRCMRNDRQSVLEQWSLNWEEATRFETRLGLETINSGETQAGAQRFKNGIGRHGAFNSS
ncbi:MAG: crotonase/enoyl-CoA hydratase family protein [Kordiimonadaceae bacterium]|nr:crotonase/enoyl-CoA hydratase family protein [Kordiimonadaceae bacterium]MBO6570603.1 crotonase/enoyl-CoA hydratase family protein [Kordiimonadaceae bacterium]MBO6966539.1 crotonase/enoyl-CoA hydratase family protein [Kordiimonadaceae bacterium]